MNMCAKLLEDLKEQFTIVDIDFYEDGEITYFLFYANEVSEIKAYELYEDYDKKYNNDEFVGAFVEYLDELGIKYYVLSNNN